MQDIDFGRIYRQKSRFPARRYSLQKKNPSWEIPFAKLSIFVPMILFALGIYLGSRFERYRITQQMEVQTLAKEEEKEFKSANLPPVPKTPVDNINKESTSPKKIEQTIKESKEVYLILARIYEDEKEAYRQGRELKEQGFPVFLAKSGNKTKVYVGPLEGKEQAYGELAKIKAMANFRGAILYKK